jgi:hypothetical protein
MIKLSPYKNYKVNFNRRNISKFIISLFFIPSFLNFNNTQKKTIILKKIDKKIWILDASD